jgi:hypothetical protein
VLSLSKHAPFKINKLLLPPFDKLRANGGGLDFCKGLFMLKFASDSKFITLILETKFKSFEALKCMHKKTMQILLLLTICLVLNSCGTKGPLYIPEQQYPQPAAGQ